MGGKFSPYAVIRQIHWLEEIACGDPTDPDNPFRYDEVRLNCPGSPAFDPSQPTVIKWNSKEGCIACAVVTYVDDARGAGPSANAAFLARDRLGKKIQSAGAQDAIRKAGFPSQAPQAWIGGNVVVTPDAIMTFITQEKWDKSKGILRAVLEELEASSDDRPRVVYKALEKKTGFLSHVALTYKDFRPFLRGFYLTLNSWRPGFQDWELSEEGVEEVCNRVEDTVLAAEFGTKDTGRDGKDPPTETVRASGRLAADVRALMALTDKEFPTVKQVRHREARILFYGFTDASGTGGGASFTNAYEESNLTYRVSVWTAEQSLESSNWREFTKLVEALEEEAKAGQLKDALVFMFTDNSTVEAAIYSGSSSSVRLHALVVRFLALQMLHNCSVEVYHVAGTRMIAQGTDGISRGALNEGVMDGKPMLSFLPLHLNALERSCKVRDWLLTWLPGDPIFLEPMDWFQRGHGIVRWAKNTDGSSIPVFAETSVLVWTPPPYAADVAIAEFRKAVHKRPTHTHAFICPRLCHPRWRRHFYRACDAVVEIPAGTPGWPTEMYELLLIGLIFPFLRVRPWQLRGTPRMFELARSVRQVCKDDGMDPGPLLREFCELCLRVQFMPSELVRRVLYFGTKP